MRVFLDTNILMDAVEVASVTTEQFANAMQFGPVRDFEDLLQYQCAVAAGCDVEFP